MSKLERIRNREPYTRNDGVEMCFSHQAENMSIYEPCQFSQAAAAWGGQNWGFVFFVVILLAVGLTWGGSYITARQSDYDRLFTAVKRSMGQ